MTFVQRGRRVAFTTLARFSKSRRGLFFPAAGFVALCTLAVAADYFFPPDLSRAKQQALILRDCNGLNLDARVSADGSWRLTTRSVDVDPAYLTLLLKTEDRRFWWHPGVDPFSVMRAAWQLALRGHIVSGGSTLAMQTARLLTPHRHTWRGKIEDAFRAIQLEWRYGHAGVLDLYLTLAPEGGSIEGVRAGSLRWFGHEPERLSLAESALLVALPRRPTALRPDRHPDAALRATARVLANVNAAPPSVLALRLEAARIPHDSPSLLAHEWRGGVRGVLRTSLDRARQETVQRILRAVSPPRRGGWAALVLRRDGSVMAWVGNAGNECPGCDADMVTAWRSPGSTMKPFIYGLAFQQGLLTPDTIVHDNAERFSNYTPRNYDRVFHGAITVRKALQQSYNLPAVRALDLIGARYFAATLHDNGVDLRLPGGTSPSLAIALGGAGVRMLDLGQLYNALARGGLSSPPTISWPAPKSQPTRLFSTGAARQILSILRGAPMPVGLANARDRDLAFKTGTSYGQRDAWAAGVCGGWTVVVWGGRPDGAPSPGITGLRLAAPLMVQIMNTLPIEPTEMGAPLPALGELSPSLEILPERQGPHIVSPPDGAVVESFADDGSATPIGLEASGGAQPYRWIINGRTLSVESGVTPSWLPDGPGFAHVAVVDAQGRGAAATVRVR
ncbi:penicillin-binding protein 1C [Acetobacter sacchari]|uniref:peptidoglycan glycosyltransferase n=1 Tax=Acetobacter sacchari TaxID=2661687 RepID=A0ABS3LX42_9PROT|nr:penicillin-binding protein 1C [Acetobacter sacchari]MBO1360471.1 penicillin-binding protein 1C [Acetobacter sacchari]